MEKSIGYYELKVDDQIIPLKCGMRAVEGFLDVLGIDLDTRMELFKQVPNPKVPDTEMSIPKQYSKFMAVAIWASANYAAETTNGKFHDLMDAYEWIDKIGLYSQQVQDFYVKFYFCVFTGKVMPEVESTTQGSKKKPLKSAK